KRMLYILLMLILYPQLLASMTPEYRIKNFKTGLEELKQAESREKAEGTAGKFAQHNEAMFEELTRNLKKAETELATQTAQGLAPTSSIKFASKNYSLRPFGNSIHVACSPISSFLAITSLTGDMLSTVSFDKNGLMGAAKNYPLPFNSMPYGAAFSPDGKNIAVPCWGSNKILFFT